MSINPSSYPLVLRIVKGWIEISQPDLEICRIRGKIDDLKRPSEIGDAVMEVWKEVIERLKANPEIVPSTPRMAVAPRGNVSLGKAAKILAIDIKSVRKMCEEGKFSAFQTPGGHWKIRLTDPVITKFTEQEIRNQ